MANGLSSSAVRLEYNKTRKRVLNRISSMKRRGYRFDSDFKLPPIPKKPTLASIRRLQKYSTKYLYSKSTAISEVTGKVISGTEKQKEVRKLSAKQCTITRKNKRKKIKEEYDLPKYDGYFETEEDYNIFIEERDKVAMKRLQEDEEYRNKFTQAEMHYNTIMDELNSRSHMFSKSAEHIKKLLEEEIGKYGYDKVMLSISQAPEDFVEAVRYAIKYKVETEQHMSAFTNLIHLIRGSVISAREMRELESVLEQDAYED